MPLPCHPRTLVAHLGEHDTTAQEGFEQHIRVVKAIRFPKYNARTLDNDLMMVKLVQPAQIDPYVQPICLSRSCPVSGTDCLVSGWGNLLTDGGKILGARDKCGWGGHWHCLLAHWGPEGEWSRSRLTPILLAV